MSNEDTPGVPPARPVAKSSSGMGTFLMVLGIVVMVITANACMAYGVSQMGDMGPAEKAALKSTVRMYGALPMLAGVALLIVGIRQRKAAKRSGQ